MYGSEGCDMEQIAVKEDNGRSHLPAVNYTQINNLYTRPYRVIFNPLLSLMKVAPVYG